MATIYEFKRGDVITRTGRAVSTTFKYDFLTGELIQVPGCARFIGDKLLFRGVANGCIYFQVIEGINDLNIIPTDLMYLIDEDYSDDWAYYIDPLTLANNEEIDLENLSDSQLDEQISKAIKEEDYEKVEKLKKKRNKK
jgi:hypothetical protein